MSRKSMWFTALIVLLSSVVVWPVFGQSPSYSRSTGQHIIVTVGQSGIADLGKTAGFAYAPLAHDMVFWVGRYQGNTYNGITVRDIDRQLTTRLTTESQVLPSSVVGISPNGRYIVFQGYTERFGTETSFRIDRDADENGVFDEITIPGGVDVSVILKDSNEKAVPAVAHSVDNQGNVVVTTYGEYVGFPLLSGGHTFGYSMETKQATLISQSDTGETDRTWFTSTSWNQFGPVISVSPNGRYLAFSTDNEVWRKQACNQNDCYQTYLRDRDTDANGIYDETGGFSTKKISINAIGEQANCSDRSRSLSVSDTGLVVFRSCASNLATDGQTTTSIGSHRVFLWNGIQSEVLTPLSADGKVIPANGPVISANGLFVAYHNSSSQSDYGYEQGVYLLNLQTRQLEYLSVQYPNSHIVTRPDGSAAFELPLAISNDGRYITATCDTEYNSQGCVHDRGDQNPVPTPTSTPLPQPTVSVHSGFNPGVDGYGFDNYNAQGNWETYVETYDIQNANSQTAREWFDNVYKPQWSCAISRGLCSPGYGAGGACFGMTSTSGLIYAEKISIPQKFGVIELNDAERPDTTPLFTPLAISFWQHTPVSDLLMVFQGRQHTKEFQCEVLISKDRSLEATVRLIQKSIESKLKDNPQLLTVTGPKNDGYCVTHSLLPVGWEGDDKHVTFSVYDPSKNGIEFKTVTVNLAAGTWQADMSANSGWGVWNSTQTCLQEDKTTAKSELRAESATVAMTARMPIFSETDIQYCDQLIKDGYVIVSFGASANVEGGDAERFPSSGLSDYQPLPLQHYMFNKSHPVTVTLEFHTSHASVHLVQPGRIFAVESDAVTGTVDTVNVDMGQNEVMISTDSSGTRGISAVSETRRIDISGLAMERGNTLLTRFEQQQVLVSPDYRQGEYTLHVLNIGITSTVEYTLTMPAISPEDMHLLQPSITSEVVLVGIDAGSDGDIDDTIELKPIGSIPSSHRLYLPLVNR